MTKVSNLLSFAALGAVAFAQSSTVSLLLLDTDTQSLVASVVEANPTSTVYVLNCPTGTDSDECGTYNEWVTAGKDFYAMNMTQGDFSATWSCDVAGTTSASCSESFGGSEANFPGTTKTELSASEITYFPVVVTAGAEKLDGKGASATAAPSANSASSTGALAATTTAPILFPEVDPKQLAASVVSAGPSTTIYQIDCASGPNRNESCPFGSSSEEGEVQPWVTVAQGFFGLNLTQQNALTVTISCAVSSTSLASCVERLTELTEEGSAPMTMTNTTTLALAYGQVTVTGGIEKLATATGGSGGSSASSTGAAPRETGGLGLLAVAAVAGAGMLV